MGDNLIAVCGGEVFRSTDLGNTWLDANNGIEYTSDATTLYPFGSDLFVLTGFNIGVAISEDTAQSWQPRNDKGLLGENMSAIVSFGDTILVNEAGPNLFRSTDTGKNWENIPYNPISNPFTLDENIRALAASGGYVYAGCDTGGVFRSSDGGSTWQNVLSLPRDTPVRCMAAMGSYIFAGVGSRWTSVGYVYRSTDWGSTWKIANAGLSDSAWPWTFFVLNNNIFVCEGNVCQSSDSGNTWSNVSANMGSQGTRALVSGLGYLFAGGDNLYHRPLSDFDKSGVASSGVPNAISISIFPNPGANALQVLGGPSGTARLFDLLGRERAESQDDGAGVTLDISHLEAGAYFLRIGNQSAKVEIAH